MKVLLQGAILAIGAKRPDFDHQKSGQKNFLLLRKSNQVLNIARNDKCPKKFNLGRGSGIDETN